MKLPADSVIAREKVTNYLLVPLGVGLRVRSVWMTEHLSGVTKFVTLIPIDLIRS